MTLKEGYDLIGADYEGLVERVESEERAERFALKFLKDKSCERLIECIENEDYEEAFRAAHSIKGISLNLGFTQLYNISSLLTEELRDGKKLTNRLNLEKTTEEYNRTREMLINFQKQKITDILSN